MANRFLVAIVIGGLLAIGAGCGGTDDESVFMPTPTQGPPTPTPLPICEGIVVPPGLGCRAFTWQQPESNPNAGTQLFTTLPGVGGAGFVFLPALAPNGIDPGGNFIDLPPGLALVAQGFPDAIDGTVEVRVELKAQDQLAPGFVVIGIKPILDYICLKIELETQEGTLFCDADDTGGVDTRITAATGITSPLEDVIEFPVGDSTPAGSLVLRVRQQQGRIKQSSSPNYETCFTLPECPGPDEPVDNEDDRRFDCYRPAQDVIYTTGTAFGMKGLTPLLNADGGEGVSGEPFECGLAWTVTDGPGMLVQGLVDNDANAPPPRDVATALRISD